MGRCPASHPVNSPSLRTAFLISVTTITIGAVALEAVGPSARREIETLFPDMPRPGHVRMTSQPVLRAFEAEAVRAYAS